MLIGVNKYTHLRGLTGAVKDASDVRTFLLAQHPPVRAERIITLNDEAATAANIIAIIQGLCNNDVILHGDPILIYYAGHGATMPKPPGWPASTSLVQCLAPHDACVIGEHVEGVVPDLTFGALLQELARAKGDKIVRPCSPSNTARANSGL